MSVGTSATVLDQAPYVYASAVAASRDRETAGRVTERVLISAAYEGIAPVAARRELIERAVLLSMRVAPAEPFDLMREEDRECVALARLAHYSVTDIALVLELGVGTVKARLRSGLATLAGEELEGCVSEDAALRMRQLRPGCESGASPARAARVS